MFVLIFKVQIGTCKPTCIFMFIYFKLNGVWEKGYFIHGLLKWKLFISCLLNNRRIRKENILVKIFTHNSLENFDPFIPFLWFRAHQGAFCHLFLLSKDLENGSSTKAVSEHTLVPSIMQLNFLTVFLCVLCWSYKKLNSSSPRSGSRTILYVMSRASFDMSDVVHVKVKFQRI